MAKLKWDDIGSRHFEVGVDRGVLYLPTGLGVSWNGLVSVSEAPYGSELKDHYLDGIKYLSYRTPEQFGGRIEAFTYPDEFEEFDGIYSLNGMNVYQQSRKPFNLSYRTAIGNDTLGVDFGYKIHLIYNVLVAPSTRSYSSLSDSVDPAMFSWDYTTTPVRNDTTLPFIPGSHVTIDSTKTDADKMYLIEDHIYGSDTRDPQVLSIGQLYNIFKNDLAALTIYADPTTGMSTLGLPVSGEGDLTGEVYEGTYLATPSTRLTPTATPGLYTI